MARYMDGKLYVATHGAGLQVFDPKTETWKGYGPEQGLPSSDVDQFFPIGGGVLYCNTRRTHYMLNLAGGVTLVHRADQRNWEQDWVVNWNLLSAWRDAERVVAIGDNGIWDNLLGKPPKRLPSPGVLCVADMDGRRLCFCNNGLFEIAPDGTCKLIRAWQRCGNCDMGLGTMFPGIFTYGDCPVNTYTTAVSAVGSCFLIVGNACPLTIYDTKTDTWYRSIPILSGWSVDPLAGSHCIWGASLEGMKYFSLDDAIAYAKSRGLVMTTAEYRERRQQIVDTFGPLDREFRPRHREFDSAKAAFRQVLDAEPDQPDALLLMGILHVREGLNQPDEAIKYFSRASELENDPLASYTGMDLWFRVLLDRQQWKEAGDLGDKILQRYPTMDQWCRRDVEQLRERLPATIDRERRETTAGENVQ